MSRWDWFVVAVLAAVVILILMRKSNITGIDRRVVEKIAQAIARAEGFYVNGSIPQRLNNPGDLTVDLTGRGIGKEGMFIRYATPEDGWQALYTQIEMMLRDTSGIYNRDMSIAQVAARYTATEQNIWATNVAKQLGVTTDTRLKDIVA